MFPTEPLGPRLVPPHAVFGATSTAAAEPAFQPRVTQSAIADAVDGTNVVTLVDASVGEVAE